MTQHLENFLELRSRNAPGSIESIRETALKFVQDDGYLKSFNFKVPYTSILVGQVQSGKTGHYLGIAAAVADLEPRFPIYVLLTQSLVALQQQTYSEAKQLLTTFDVFDEGDELPFRHSLRYARPKLVVLKKNMAPLTAWNNILSQELLAGRPLFVIDDEADAAGMNSKINKAESSEINIQIKKLVETHRSFYLQVTATPQSIFLQQEDSFLRPKSHLYFHPGTDYLGGNFFYPTTQAAPDETPYVFRETQDNELTSLQNPIESELPAGLVEAIRTFILTAAYRIGYERDAACNFLLHPSTKTVDHNLIRDKVNRFVLDTIDELGNKQGLEAFRESYSDLKKTKPQLPELNVLLREGQRTAFNVIVMNSSPGNLSRGLPGSGANILIGGNVLSRGIVVPKLQTIYYCRTARRLTIDTYWQHSRAFGYDRDAGLVRLFMPAPLYRRFVQMSDSIMQLFERMQTQNTDEIQVVTPSGMLPTRSSIVFNLANDSIVGGSHHFPVAPAESAPEHIDLLLSSFPSSEDFHVIPASTAIQLLSETQNRELGGIDIKYFLQAMQNVNRNGQVTLIVRRDRAVSANTGTLISANDRELANSFANDSVLILYRLTGGLSLGWKGNPFWIPDVKLMDDKVVYFKK